MEMDESGLIRKVLSGDEEARTLFYRQYSKRMYPICVHFLGYQDAEAEDIVQETFLIAFGKLKDFVPRASLYTWMAHICANLCYARLRRRKRVLASLQEDLEILTAPQSAGREEAAEEGKERDRRLEVLEKTIATMSEKCREVLELRDRRGESYARISDLMKVPLGTVMSRLAYCREALRNLVRNGMEGEKG